MTSRAPLRSSGLEAARALPSDGWLARLAEDSPFGPIEAFLSEVRGMVYARAKAQDAGYGLETELAEPDGALVARPRRRSARSKR
jgi:ATP-dependent DNA helicase DinG